MQQSTLPGIKVLLLGASGSGKTHSFRTLVDAGITPFVLFTENSMRTISDIPDAKLHWRYLAPAQAPFDTLLRSAESVNTLSFEGITKQQNWNKKEYRQFIEVLTTMNDFVCDRCGEHFGSVDTWGTDRALVIDSLSGLNIMAMDLAVGSKPVKSPGDWGVAMDVLERFINRMATGVYCHFVLTGHLERERDEMSGRIMQMASTLGQKLAPKIPRYFDDVVQVVRDGTKFNWSTGSPNVDTKGRNLAISENLPPSFVPLIESWKKAGGATQARQLEDK